MRQKQDGAAGPIGFRREFENASDISADCVPPPANRIAAALSRTRMDGQTRRVREGDDAGRANAFGAGDGENFARTADVDTLTGPGHARAEEAAPCVHGPGDDRRALASRTKPDLAHNLGEVFQRWKALARAGNARDQRLDIGQVLSDNEEIRHRVGDRNPAPRTGTPGT